MESDEEILRFLLPGRKSGVVIIEQLYLLETNGRFLEYNRLINLLDLDAIGSSASISLLSVSFLIKDFLPGRSSVFSRIKSALRVSVGEDRASLLVDRFQ